MRRKSRRPRPNEAEQRAARAREQPQPRRRPTADSNPAAAQLSAAKNEAVRAWQAGDTKSAKRLQQQALELQKSLAANPVAGAEFSLPQSVMCVDCGRWRGAPGWSAGGASHPRVLLIC